MNDILTAVGSFILGCFVIMESSGYPRQGDVEMHPGHYPGILGYIMVALAICLAVKILWKGREPSPPSDIAKTRLALLVAALTLYCFSMEYLGYALSTFLFVTVAVRLFRGSGKTSVVTGLGAAVLLGVTFRFIFKAPLPPGILF